MSETVNCTACRKTVSALAVNGYGQCDVCCERILREQRKRVAAHPEVDVRPGDSIAIRHPTGTYLGTVSWAINWGDTIGWHIGFVHTTGSAGRVGDPAAWKCGSDGGTVEVRSRPSPT